MCIMYVQQNLSSRPEMLRFGFLSEDIMQIMWGRFHILPIAPAAVIPSISVMAANLGSLSLSLSLSSSLFPSPSGKSLRSGLIIFSSPP